MGGLCSCINGSGTTGSNKEDIQLTSPSAGSVIPSCDPRQTTLLAEPIYAEFQLSATTDFAALGFFDSEEVTFEPFPPLYRQLISWNDAGNLRVRGDWQSSYSAVWKEGDILGVGVDFIPEPPPSSSSSSSSALISVSASATSPASTSNSYAAAYAASKKRVPIVYFTHNGFRLRSIAIDDKLHQILRFVGLGCPLRSKLTLTVAPGETPKGYAQFLTKPESVKFGTGGKPKENQKKSEQENATAQPQQQLVEAGASAAAVVAPPVDYFDLETAWSVQKEQCENGDVIYSRQMVDAAMASRESACNAFFPVSLYPHPVKSIVEQALQSASSSSSSSSTSTAAASEFMAFRRYLYYEVTLEEISMVDPKFAQPPEEDEEEEDPEEAAARLSSQEPPIPLALAGLGYSWNNYPHDLMPGWKFPSMGYHGDDGKVFVRHRGLRNGQGVEYGPKWTKGITVGFALHRHGYDAFITINGSIRLKTLPLTAYGLSSYLSMEEEKMRGCIGFPNHSNSDRIRINTKGPFLFKPELFEWGNQDVNQLPNLTHASILQSLSGSSSRALTRSNSSSASDSPDAEAGVYNDVFDPYSCHWAISHYKGDCYHLRKSIVDVEEDAVVICNCLPTCQDLRPLQLSPELLRERGMASAEVIENGEYEGASDTGIKYFEIHIIQGNARKSDLNETSRELKSASDAAAPQSPASAASSSSSSSSSSIPVTAAGGSAVSAEVAAPCHISIGFCSSNIRVTGAPGFNSESVGWDGTSLRVTAAYATRGVYGKRFYPLKIETDKAKPNNVENAVATAALPSSSVTIDDVAAASSSSSSEVPTAPSIAAAAASSSSSSYSSPSSTAAHSSSHDDDFTPWREGEIIGAGLEGKTFFFTRNGVRLPSIPVEGSWFYQLHHACIGFGAAARYERVYVNFGQKPFAYQPKWRKIEMIQQNAPAQDDGNE